ncbi:MAG TPA: PAS domain S-box protein [Verrucomicrobiae bacterium]|nr:PAS domain S-box protein [Verrucomicrobiae bacterium]
MHAISEAKLAKQAFDKRFRFEALLTELSAAFANLPPGQVDSEIDKWLERLVEVLGVDRASFLHFGQDGAAIRSHTVTVSGLEPLSVAAINERFPWIVEQLRRGNTVKWPRIPEDIPLEAVNERAYAIRKGIRSGLNVPVSIGGSVICAISFTSIRACCDWPEEVVTRLRVVGEVFANAFVRKRAEEALRESQQQNRALVNSIDGIVWEVDAATFRFNFVSSQAERILGYPVEQWLREDGFWANHIHPDDRDTAVNFCVGATARREDHQFEYRMIAADGRVVWVRDFVTVTVLESGQVLLRGVIVDITERKRAEDEVRKEKEILQKIFDCVPLMIAFFDQDGCIKLINRDWERTIGWSLEEIQKQNLDILAECYPDPQYRQGVLDFIAATKGDWGDFKTKVRNGRVIDTTWANVRLSDGTSVGIGQDITERKRVEDELRGANERLQRLSRRLLELQETERRFMARELHDEIGQSITAVTLNLQNAKLMLEPSKIGAALNESIGILNRVLQQVRDLSLDLRPSILDHVGLAAAIRWQVDRQAQRAGFKAEVVADERADHLAPEVEIACYRIIQEALTNIARHAKAQNVRVEVRYTHSQMHLLVLDDGVGFDLRNARERVASLGIVGMEERTLFLKGEFEIESAPRRGTAIRVRFPLTLHESESDSRPPG